MGSIDQFFPGLAAGSSAVDTGSQVVDGGADIFAEVLTFFGGIVSQVTDALGS